jgi:hypothetical protein
MKFSIRSIHDNYIRGEAVDRATDSLLARICRSSGSELSDVDKISAKVSMCWSAISLAAMITTHLTALSPVGVIVNLALVPFAMPLFRNVKKLIAEVKKEPSYVKRDRVAALWFALICGQSAFACGVGRNLSLGARVSIALAFSDVSLGGGLLLTRAILRKHEMSDADRVLFNCKIACEKLPEEINKIIYEIESIDAFVKNNSELKEVVQKHLQKYGQYIAFLKAPQKADVIDPNDWISLRAELEVKKVRLEHELNQRKKFIQSHTEVYVCFRKHVLAMRTVVNNALIELEE